MLVTRAIAVAAVVASIAVPHAAAAPPAPLDRADTYLATSPAALARTAGARDLLALLDPGGDGTVLAVATRATSIHAADFGFAVTTPSIAGHRSPSAAAAAIARRYGVPADASIHDLDRLPAHVREPLTDVLDAFIAFDAAATVATANADRARIADLSSRFAELDRDDATTLRELGIDLGPVLGARLALLDAALRLRDAAAGQVMAADVSLCPALSIDLTSGPTTYPLTCALVVDTIGEDTYLNNAGGACLIPPAAAVLDFDGDDTYGPSNYACSNGAGFAGGAGFLLDTDGDDTYTAVTGVANGGAGLGGSGMLVDTDGDDAYLCDTTTAVNGGAVVGSGVLLDLDGSDTYRGDGAANGTGEIGGSGMLVDADGDDTYVVHRNAGNGAGAVGSGFLLDVRGDDSYSAHGTATNGAGFAGTGFLFDGLGNARYSGGGLSNGGGALGGVGVLIDADGVDSYVASHIWSNGFGVFGLGLLLDGGGTGDTYTDPDGTTTDHTVPRLVVGVRVDVPR